MQELTLARPGRTVNTELVLELEETKLRQKFEGAWWSAERWRSG
jgi:hypothetical protein